MSTESNNGGCATARTAMLPSSSSEDLERQGGFLQHSRARRLFLLKNKWVTALPALTSFFLMALTEVTRQMAVAAGHCDVPAGKGKVARIQIPPVSPATRLAPERWVWTFGVDLTWLLLLCPTMLLGWEVYSESRHKFCCCPMSKFIYTLMVVGSVFLVGEATIPLQEDILTATQLTVGSILHLVFAGLMFLCLLLHAALATFWQFCLCSGSNGQPIFSRKSLVLKLCVVILGALSVTSVLPVALMMLLPDEYRMIDVLFQNLGGMTQRCIVFCIVAFVATYSLDLHNLRCRLLEERREGHPEQELAC